MSVADEVHAHANAILSQAKNQTDVETGIQLVVADLNARFLQLKQALDNAIVNADPVMLNQLSDLINALCEAVTMDEEKVSDAILANTQPLPEEPMPAALQTEQQPKPPVTPTPGEIERLKEEHQMPPPNPPAPFDTAHPAPQHVEGQQEPQPQPTPQPAQPAAPATLVPATPGPTGS